MNTRKKRRLALEHRKRAARKYHYLWSHFENMTLYRGINYAGRFGKENINPKTGIRYGVIPAHNLSDAWYEVEIDYGPPFCPECGNEAKEVEQIEVDTEEWKTKKGRCGDYGCESCEILFDGEDCFNLDEGGTPYVDDGEYKASQDDRGDVWVFQSPYFTRAQFCSPCAPGACYLNKPCPTGERAYCFGPDWFNKYNPCPHPIWEVKTGKLVFPN